MKIYLTLPIFLDVHSIGTSTEEDLIKAQNAPRDELGVKGGEYSLQSRRRNDLLLVRCTK